jgi:hypothetical protein
MKSETGDDGKRKETKQKVLDGSEDPDKINKQTDTN